MLDAPTRVRRAPTGDRQVRRTEETAERPTPAAPDGGSSAAETRASDAGRPTRATEEPQRRGGRAAAGRLRRHRVPRVGGAARLAHGRGDAPRRRARARPAREHAARTPAAPTPASTPRRSSSRSTPSATSPRAAGCSASTSTCRTTWPSAPPAPVAAGYSPRFAVARQALSLPRARRRRCATPGGARARGACPCVDVDAHGSARRRPPSARTTSPAFRSAGDERRDTVRTLIARRRRARGRSARRRRGRRGRRVPLQHGAHPGGHDGRRGARAARSPARVARALEARDRRVAGTTAPAHGLVLEQVDVELPEGDGRAVAALTRAERVSVARRRCPARAPRSPRSGASCGTRTRRGAAIPGSRDPRVYAQLARRLDEDARVRGGPPHPRAVTCTSSPTSRASPCGQVEGWFERHGVDADDAVHVRGALAHRDARARGLGAGGRCSTRSAACRASRCRRARRACSPPRCSSRTRRTRSTTRVGYVPVVVERAHRLGARGTPDRRHRARARVARAARRPRRSRCLESDARRAPPRRRATCASTARAPSTPRWSAPSPRTSAPTRREPARDPATLVAVDAVGVVVRPRRASPSTPLEPPFVAHAARPARPLRASTRPARRARSSRRSSRSRAAWRSRRARRGRADRPAPLPAPPLHDAALASGADALVARRRSARMSAIEPVSLGAPRRRGARLP